MRTRFRKVTAELVEDGFVPIKSLRGFGDIEVDTYLIDKRRMKRSKRRWQVWLDIYEDEKVPAMFCREPALIMDGKLNLEALRRDPVAFVRYTTGLELQPWQQRLLMDLVNEPT